MLKTAEQQKTLNAEKQISYARAMVIVFGTFSFCFLDEANIKKELAYPLIVAIWLYGAYVLYAKPYEKYPVFLASWFTYVSDSIFATLWIYATGGFYSPYHVIFYTSIIAVAFRFNLSTTLFTASLYTGCYFILLISLDQVENHFALAMVRTGFIFIIGFLTYFITRETLIQTKEKLEMQRLAEEAKQANVLLAESQAKLSFLNEQLQLRNNIFNHAEENAMMGSYAWNLNTNTLDYSDNLFRLLGEEPRSFVPSFEKYMSFLHPEDREELIKMTTKEPGEIVPIPGIYRIILGGETKYLRATGQIIEEGRDRVMIGTLQDVTEDLRRQDELQIKNLELEQINHQLASFNYFASHDLQEPVRKIQTFSNLVMERERERLTEQGLSYLERITASASRMQHLVKAFLNYSRIDSTEVVYEKTDLNQMVDDIRISLHELIEEKNAVIEAAALPVILADPLQFHQLLTNLLSNAIKYSKPDVPPIVRVTAEKIMGSEISDPQANPGSSYWLISVHDNGIGFESKHAEKIFEVFHRLHSKDKYGGSGIGLAICKKVAASHGGFISAESTLGKGSVFRVYLPAEKRY